MAEQWYLVGRTYCCCRRRILMEKRWLRCISGLSEVKPYTQNHICIPSTALHYVHDLWGEKYLFALWHIIQSENEMIQKWHNFVKISSPTFDEHVEARTEIYLLIRTCLFFYICNFERRENNKTHHRHQCAPLPSWLLVFVVKMMMMRGRGVNLGISCIMGDTRREKSVQFKVVVIWLADKLSIHFVGFPFTAPRLSSAAAATPFISQRRKIRMRNNIWIWVKVKLLEMQVVERWWSWCRSSFHITKEHLEFGNNSSKREIVIMKLITFTTSAMIELDSNFFWKVRRRFDYLKIWREFQFGGTWKKSYFYLV